MEAFLSILVGIGLAAATGFRVFVPFLALSLAARTDYLELAGGFAWIESTPALITFGAATLLEIGAYYVPWLDHLLDSIASPAAVVAGIVLTAAATGDLSPWLSWSLAVLAGGGVAGVFQGMTAGTRALTGLATGGLGNPLVSTLELGLSAVLSVLAIVVPVVAILLVLVLLVVAVRRLRGRARRRPDPGLATPH